MSRRSHVLHRIHCHVHRPRPLGSEPEEETRWANWLNVIRLTPPGWYFVSLSCMLWEVETCSWSHAPALSRSRNFSDGVVSLQLRLISAQPMASISCSFAQVMNLSCLILWLTSKPSPLIFSKHSLNVFGAFSWSSSPRVRQMGHHDQIYVC